MSFFDDDDEGSIEKNKRFKLESNNEDSINRVIKARQKEFGATSQSQLQRESSSFPVSVAPAGPARQLGRQGLLIQMPSTATPKQTTVPPKSVTTPASLSGDVTTANGIATTGKVTGGTGTSATAVAEKFGTEKPSTSKVHQENQVVASAIISRSSSNSSSSARVSASTGADRQSEFARNMEYGCDSDYNLSVERQVSLDDSRSGAANRSSSGVSTTCSRDTRPTTSQDLQKLDPAMTDAVGAASKQLASLQGELEQLDLAHQQETEALVSSAGSLFLADAMSSCAKPILMVLNRLQDIQERLKKD